MDAKHVVPVFGAYFNGNFGDDLMGHLIAEKLVEAGYEPLLWRGPDYPISGKRWKTANCVDEFLKDANCVVFGGGMVFCNSNFPEYWQGMSDILDECEARNLPIIAISVGSDGHFDSLHPVANRLIRSPMFVAASLRLEADVKYIREVAKNASIVRFSDIVLTSSKLRERKRISNVIVCLPVGKMERFLLRGVFSIMRLRKIKVQSISQFTDESPMSKHFMKIAGYHISNQGVDSLLQAVRESDVVIGRGLHVGMTGLAGGAAFISYKGTGKSVTFLREIGRGESVVGANQFLMKPFLFIKLLHLIRPSLLYISDFLRENQADAEQHYCFMLDRLNDIQAGQYQKIFV